MTNIYSDNISITLATIIGNAILPTTSGTIESRHLDALSYDKASYDIIFENRKRIIATGNIKDATALAKKLINV